MRIGIDLGGTKTEIAVLNAHGEIVFRQRCPTPSHSYTDILNAIVALVDTAVTQTAMPRPLQIGIGMPGCLDVDTALVRGSNTQVLNHQPLKKDLEENRLI